MKVLIVDNNDSFSYNLKNYVEQFSAEVKVIRGNKLDLNCIDEFDKMNKDDRSRMHEAMEQQKIHISKGGINATMRTRCAVLAAANPEQGRFSNRSQAGYDISPLFEEVKLPPALISRFDIIWLLRDDIVKEQDTQIAEHILSNRRHASHKRLLMMMQNTQLHCSIIGDMNCRAMSLTRG